MLPHHTVPAGPAQLPWFGLQTTVVVNSTAFPAQTKFSVLIKHTDLITQSKGLRWLPIIYSSSAGGVRLVHFGLGLNTLARINDSLGLEQNFQ